MSTPLYRPAQRRGLVFLGLVLLALIILVGMVWRNSYHFQTILSYVNDSHRVQNVSVGLQQLVVNYLAESDSNVTPMSLGKTLQKIDSLIAGQPLLSATNRQIVQHIKATLIDLEPLGRVEKSRYLSTILSGMSDALNKESLQRERLLEDINLDTQTELCVFLMIFALIGLGALFFLYFRILRPLNDLRQLLETLTEGDYKPITTHHLDPLLVPVFASYNHMVSYLAELEEANRQHTQLLQQEVRLVTQALLEQQYSLAKAERLAAIGEMSAELAHEIRNPLAGIQMAFSNLRREITDSGQAERIQMIEAELRRLTHLLNGLLDQSKHAPESATHFDLSVLIHDLVALARYQIAENINISVDVPPLPVYLPESEIRQVLLNLILNAAQALLRQGGNISLKASKDRQSLYIQITDNGAGFSQTLLEQGIRPFHTGHSQGTGLGLAIVQRFIKDMGGAIKLSNRLPQGACVLLQLPYA